MSVKTFDEMIGVVMASVGVNGSNDVLAFNAEDGREFRFFHDQDCCESVGIEDIVGDLGDLVGHSILTAEEVDSSGHPAPQSADSYTWTFYRFATAAGTVTVRWLGESNGYYSESVSYEVISKKRKSKKPRLPKKQAEEDSGDWPEWPE